MCVKVSLFKRVISTLSENRVWFPIQNVMASQCWDCTTGISPDLGSLVGLGPRKRWHAVHVGTVGFRIDRQALRELRSDWPDSTTFLRSGYGRQGWTHPYSLIKERWTMYCTRKKERWLCRFIRLKEDKRLKRESSLWCTWIRVKERGREKKGGSRKSHKERKQKIWNGTNLEYKGLINNNNHIILEKYTIMIQNSSML